MGHNRKLDIKITSRFM